jgi:RNA-directed DNA polymerase
VCPTRCGTPWLGFVVYPEKRLLKARKARHASRHLSRRAADWRAGHLSFADFDAAVQGWINHARQGDTWGLRRTVFALLAAIR